MLACIITIQCRSTHLTHRCNNGCTNAPQSCVKRTFLVLFHLSEPAWYYRRIAGSGSRYSYDGLLVFLLLAWRRAFD